MTKKIGKKIQVNIEMDMELAIKLDQMRTSDENTRSQFIRKILRKEWVRRYKGKVNAIPKSNQVEA